MSGFFDRMLGRNKDTASANKAKERLQFVLIHDRVNLPPERLKAMKEEILAVISKYVAVSRDEVEIALEQRDRNKNKLIAEIPFSKSLGGEQDDPLKEEDDQKPSAYNSPPAPEAEAAKALAAKAAEEEEAKESAKAEADKRADSTPADDADKKDSKSDE